MLVQLSSNQSLLLSKAIRPSIFWGDEMAIIM